MRLSGSDSTAFSLLGYCSSQKGGKSIKPVTGDDKVFETFFLAGFDLCGGNISIFASESLRIGVRFSSTYTKIGTIQRRLADY